MKTLLQIHQKVQQWLNSMKDVPLYCFRIVLGYTFLLAGWGKLHNLDKVIVFFTELGIPAPHLQAPFVAGLEFLGGILLLTGLLTRLISVPLIITMIVALVTAKGEEIASLNDLFSTSEFLFILGFLLLVLHGPGRYSADYILSEKPKQI